MNKPNPTLFTETSQAIERILLSNFPQAKLHVVDNSWHHRSHKEARKYPNKGHFKIQIFHPELVNTTRLRAHRSIYQAVSPLMHNIHALEIDILITPPKNDHTVSNHPL